MSYMALMHFSPSEWSCCLDRFRLTVGNSIILSLSQALRRGVVPDSFPSQLAAEPTDTIGQRRFVIMDHNVHALHGANFERVGDRLYFRGLPEPRSVSACHTLRYATHSHNVSCTHGAYTAMLSPVYRIT